jgi:maltose alpha-D-glucosyltransferase / alpha-amylase
VSAAEPHDPQWYKDAVIYELHVRSFHDSNGDGIGDFAGLTSKLDYLQDLGVTALWLLPFYPSPLRDDGYDIADYTAVNRDYGTMRQFKRFVKEAQDRGLRVITELVINHTSDQHAWFKRAVNAPPGSPERDFYVWSDTPNRYGDVRIIFEDYEHSNWEWHPEAKQYYWHRFFRHQPDLNFDNPLVQQAVKEALDFWMDLGVDGMRLDAIPYLFVRDGTNGENLPETHEFLKQLRNHLDANHEDKMFLAEANQWPEDAAAYFGDDDECHMNFHFPLMPRLFMAVAQEDRFPIIDILQQTPEIPEHSQWGIFLRNHDELTLEMVTDEERDYMYRAYAREPDMRVNLGIRRRLAPLLNNDRRLIELLNSLLFSLPGTPVLYYGDEIGMGDNVYLGDRNSVRTPMQWSADRNAGFSRANPQRLFLPTIIDPEYHYESVNVEAQQNNPRSLLWWMKRMIALRRRHHVFGRGSLEFLTPDNPKVLAYLRSWTPPSASVPEQVLVVANLSRYSQACELDLSGLAHRHPVEMLGRTPFPPIGEQPYVLTLGPYQCFWFSLEDELPRFALSKLPGVAGEEDHEPRPEPPTVTVAGQWTALLRGPGRERLEAALVEVLPRQRWFGGKARAIRQVRVDDAIPVGRKDRPTLHVMLVDVEYVEGESERYVLPVRFLGTEEAARWEATVPAAVLVTVKGQGQRGQSGALVDALRDPESSRALLAAVGRQRRHAGRDLVLQGRKRAGLGSASQLDELEPHPLRGEQSNTSVLYGDQLLMKVLRRLEPGVNPDVEITEHLADLEHVPQLLGTLDVVEPDGESPRTLAMLQRYVPNEGDAWAHTLDELGRFAERVVSEHAGGPRPSPAPKGSLLQLATSPIPEPVHEMAGPYLASLQLLGTRTAQMHAALAADTTDPAFAPEQVTRLYQRSLYQSLRNSVRMARRAAARGHGVLSEEDRATVQRLVEREEEILERLQVLSRIDLDAVRTRTHGDYHLGQVLWTGRDFVIIDFEGEPARPLGERRLKRSPLRDVAGMLRSLQYATSATLHDQIQRGLVTPDHPNHGTLTAWLDWWLTWASATMLRGYLEEARGHRFVPADEEHTRILLDAFLIEKALYELGYEMNNRPEWVAIPLEGIAAVLDRPGS